MIFIDMGIYRIERKSNTERRRASKRRVINQDIFKVTIFFAVLFFALAAFIVRFLAVDASGVINNTYNKRSDTMKKSVTRGEIYSKDGDILAYTETDENGNETRIYPFGSDFFHVVGFEEKGSLGLESSYNYYLLTSHDNIFKKISSEFSGQRLKGDNIITTLDVDLQQKANEILGDNEGAIIVMDPADGSILAMVSKPDYDPNSIGLIWDEITNDEDNSLLLNRATQGLFTPGSTFKIFTLLEYFRESNGEVGNYSFDCNGVYSVESGSVRCPSGIAHGLQNLKLSFAHSCNCAFSEIGLSLDLIRFAENNKNLLFNTDLDIDISSNQSSFTLDNTSSGFMVMQTAFGQGETLITPMHLAMVTCAAANNGVLMRPHLVSEITNFRGETVRTFAPEEYASLLSQDEAAFLKEYMRAVVTDGTATILSYEGNYTSYGKTGTAETLTNKEENHDHSWFTGFAENSGKTLVVCAMIENTQEAGITGVYAAKQIFDHYFGY